MSFAAPGLLGQRVTSGSLTGVVVGWADGYLLVAVDEDDGRRVLASPSVPEPAPYCACKFPDPVPLELLGKVIGHICRKCARRIKKS